MLIIILFSILVRLAILYFLQKIIFSFFNKLYHSKSRLKPSKDAINKGNVNIHDNSHDNSHEDNQTPIEYNKTRFVKRRIPENIDVIIIGSGISSLTLAGLLSKAGKRVLVVEQHYIAGGTTHSFELEGIEHETGLHYVGNIKKRMKILDLITEEDDKIEWCQLGWETNQKIYDKIIIKNNTYNFPSGSHNIENYLINHFPNEKKGLIKYFKLIKKVSSKELFFNLKSINYYFPIIETYINRFLTNNIKYIDPTYYKYCKKSAYDTIKEVIDDEELISILCGQFGDYGPPPKQANFYMHASIVNHYLEGGYFPKGGTNTISNKLIRYIENRGGSVLVGKGVKEIIIANKEAIGIVMDNEIEVYGKQIVSSVGIRNTFKKLVKQDYIEMANLSLDKSTPPELLESTKLLKSIEKYNKIIDNIPYSTQHIYCFLKIKGDPIELGLTSSNLWVYPHSNYEKLVEEFLEDPLENPIPLFIGFSCMKDPEWSKKYPGYSNGVILTLGKKEWFNEWEDSISNKRGDAYKDYKNQIGKRMVSRLYELYPQLIDKIEDYNMATPLTTQYYLGAHDGESYGLDINSYRFLEGWDLKPRTPIKNLFLTGQDICTLGFTGAMMSGVLTANVILGYDDILDIMIGNNIIKDLS